MISLVLGQFSTGGWTGYPPFTEIAFSPGVGPGLLDLGGDAVVASARR